jgi:hypothetical protein
MTMLIKTSYNDFTHDINKCDITYNILYLFLILLKLILLLTENEKLASLIAGEESELCVLMSKDVISKVIISNAVVSQK